ncbi:deoxyribose-phosphate aldolase [Burkholderia pseudomallei]|nr:deoxyribose-phosphate aldolase [Burkholderia pseudomallei]
MRALLNALLELDALARASAPPSPRLIPIERRAARDRTRRERFD